MKTYLGNLAPLPGNSAKPHPVDVVFHLGRTKRFGGWGNPEWTVLHHSMLTTLLYIRFFGVVGAHKPLLHDGHEYITGDIPTPVKNVVGREGVEKLEKYVDDAIADMLRLDDTPSYSDLSVKPCDFAALIIESFYFGGNALDIDHIGEMNWHNLSAGFQALVASIVKASCPEVYAAMVQSRYMNPPHITPPLPWVLL